MTAYTAPVSRARVPALLLALSLAACGGDDGAWSVREDLRIARSVDGVAQPPIDAAMLRSLVPDHADDERRAWRLDRFFGPELARPAALLEVTSASGPPGRIRRPGFVEGGGVWVLGLNRRGSPFLDVAPADDLGAGFHGRGGSAGRGGEPRRIRDVTALALLAGPPGSEGGSTSMLKLTVVVDGETRTLTEDDLARVEPLSVPGDSGEGKRDAWSLRTLVQALVGEGAVATEVASEGGRTQPIPPEAWADATRTPLLRLNRRGELKFHWVGPDLAPLPGEEVRKVTRVTVRAR